MSFVGVSLDSDHLTQLLSSTGSTPSIQAYNSANTTTQILAQSQTDGSMEYYIGLPSSSQPVLSDLKAAIVGKGILIDFSLDPLLLV